MPGRSGFEQQVEVSPPGPGVEPVLIVLAQQTAVRIEVDGLVVGTVGDPADAGAPPSRAPLVLDLPASAVEDGVLDLVVQAFPPEARWDPRPTPAIAILAFGHGPAARDAVQAWLSQNVQGGLQILAVELVLVGVALVFGVSWLRDRASVSELLVAGFGLLWPASTWLSVAISLGWARSSAGSAFTASRPSASPARCSPRCRSSFGAGCGAFPPGPRSRWAS